MRLIDADELREKLTELKQNKLTPSWCVVLNLIDNAPTIKTFTLLDIEEQYRKGLEKGLSEWETERPQGKWISDYRTCKCSACNFTTVIDTYNFCPSCGAEMQKG